MRPMLPLLSLLSFAASACHVEHFGRRTGPDFEDAFPDPTVLVTSPEPMELREQLANVKLPATREHHRQLLDLLQSQSRITAAHLLLLVEAVALPTDNLSYISDGNRTRIYTPRGRGEFADIADQLLIAGTDKLVDVDRTSFGELIGRTHSDAAVTKLADRLLLTLDDGSTTALREILAGMAGSPAAGPFLTGYLVSQGRLDGDRGWAAVPMLSFDPERVGLVRALGARAPSIDASRLTDAVRAMSFDEGRAAAVQALAAKAKPVPAAVARDVVAACAFDEGRRTACTALATSGDVRLDFDQLAGMVRLFSFDEGRLAAVRALAPQVHGGEAGKAPRDVLAAFSFDQGRLGALRALAPLLQQPSQAQQKGMLAAFSFSSNREVAAGLLR